MERRDRRFENRTEAGKLLAAQLSDHQDLTNGLVLALPRGGVPIGFEIASHLHFPLDVWLVRKLGVPDRPELAMGAIAASGVKVMNWDVVKWLNISPESIEQVVAKESLELQRRENLYRFGQPPPRIAGQLVILVDDGIATGATMQAAIASLRQHQPQRIIVAVPVASPSACEEIQQEVDQVVCLLPTEFLDSIGRWYEDFDQTSDQEVRHFLAEAARQFQVFSASR
ncbi:MAG: phosphoribosyltransferase [Snowella sp.]|nr:phosphoribosyltransferase [Snowella sp.]